jgi:hypothetical protein
VEITCSKYGAYWNPNNKIYCNLANNGVVGMGASDPYGYAYRESYTRERWSTCFTPRYQCTCS